MLDEARPNPCKEYVDVAVVETTDGDCLPIAVRTEAGFVYQIEDILGIKDRAPAYIAGGHGTRYTCVIRGEKHYLFHDRRLWFLELTNCLPYPERQVNNDLWYSVFEKSRLTFVSRNKSMP